MPILIPRPRTVILGRRKFRGAYDNVPNLVHVYEPARRTLTSYTGSLVRLRRASDDAEADFGYVSNGNLNVGAIAYWAGGASYIVTIYDQVGGDDVTMAVAANQPLFTANAQNGHAGGTFDGISGRLLCLTPAGFLADDAKTLVTLWTGTIAGDYHFAMATRTNYGGVNNSTKGYLYQTSTAQPAIRYGHTAAGNLESRPAIAQGTAYISAVAVETNGAGGTNYLNGTSQAITVNTLAASVAELANGYTQIGGQGGSYAGMICCAVLMLNAELSAAAVAALTNIVNAYYAVY